MKKILAVAVATAISAPAMADLTIGASTEYNLYDAGTGAEQTVENNITVTGGATAENGVFAKAFIEIESTSTDGGVSTFEVDDNYLTIGNASANVTVGQFGTSNAFNAGDDSFAPEATITGYTAKGLDDAGDQDIALNVTAIEGLTLQISGNLSDANNNDMRGTASLAAGGVTLAATVQSSDTASEDGYALSAATSVSDVAVSASYATNDQDAKSIAFTAGYDIFSVAYVRNENSSGADEAIYYTNVALGNMGLEGLSVDVGFGGGADVDTKAGVEVIYSF
jgi:hypothetical protein